VNQELYFAFGSNLNAQQMRQRCPSAQAIDTAWLPGEKLVFRSYSDRWGGGVASIVPGAGRLPGIVWAISSDDLAHLDACEGHPHAYLRERVHVQGQDGSQVIHSCWTYRLPGGALNPPSQRYLAVIRNAYASWGFNNAALPKPNLKPSPQVIAPYRAPAAPPRPRRQRTRRVPSAKKRAPAARTARETSFADSEPQRPSEQLLMFG